MATQTRWLVFVATGAMVAVAACGSDNSHVLTGVGPKGGAADDAAASGSGSSGSSSDEPGTDAGGGIFGQGDANLSADAFVGCATDTVVAKQLPLDLYFMLDTSGSMDDLAGPQQSKWSDVVTAMTAFVKDPASAGIGVGLQYFPLTMAGVPTSCTSSAQCTGNSGPCLLKACDFKYFTAVEPCDTVADCEGHNCDPVGACQYDHNTICPASSAGNDCGMDPNGFALGLCQAVSSATCVLGDSCTTADYAMPAVAIAPLPGVAAAVTASLATHHPNGNTPTAAAVQGAIDGATAFGTANPGHTVVAVLATDGIPDECSPSDIPGISNLAAAGLSGTPSVKTFTIGVFAPNGIAAGTAALNEIATAGGTGQAFIINSTAKNVEQQFASALNSIRGASLPCQYQLPVPDSGLPDYEKVNVQFTSGTGAPVTVPYVETAASCGATTGGWYYDVDPKGGGTPKAILVCTTTCSALKGDATGTIGVVLGCQTIAR
jgi:hypothetical protein